MNISGLSVVRPTTLDLKSGLAFAPQWDLVNFTRATSGFERGFQAALLDDGNKEHAATMLASKGDQKQDWCDSVGTAWVPDSIFGVDISAACQRHDVNYSSNSTMDRADADMESGRLDTCLDQNAVLHNAHGQHRPY